MKTIVSEDLSNYKYPSMLIGFPHCSFKCDKEFGTKICQNSQLANEPNIEISYAEIVKLYQSNLFTKAFVFGGLEPFDSYNDMIGLIDYIRQHTTDDIVIYTGYKEDEIIDKLNELKKYNNIIIKFGRYIPNKEKHFDDILGIKLASDNQYATYL
jgi:lipoate synthase